MQTHLPIHLALALVAAPLIRSVINKTKAWFSGRQGPPWLQPYRDLYKLAGKNAVYSTTTTWVFRAGPIVGLSVTIIALMLMPFGGMSAALSFPGDIFLFAYVLALGRLFIVLAALDTGSPFQGMGASREVQFGALIEPALLFCFVAVGHHAEVNSLNSFYGDGIASIWHLHPEVLLIMTVLLAVVMLAETSRIPVDDPTTHLELTMVHEVMVLDHGGPDLAFVEYSQALRLWIFGNLVAGIWTSVLELGWPWGILLQLVFLGLIGVLIGTLESGMARLRMIKVPQLLFAAGALAALALVFEAV